MRGHNPDNVQVQPEFSFDAVKRIGWLKFRSVAHAIAFQATHCPRDGHEPRPFNAHYGLGAQTFNDYLKSHNATHALALTRKAIAEMKAPVRTFSRPVATITGGHWDVPSVLANLPLAARARVRTKLAPINLHFVTWYGSISDIAPIFPLAARLAQAINTYTIAGGIVTLRVTAIAEGQDQKFAKVASSVNVVTSNLSEVATALSPTFHRVTQIPLRQVIQHGYSSLPQTGNFIPGARELIGPQEKLVAAFEKAISDLKIG
jgi:hypothetical protein